MVVLETAVQSAHHGHGAHGEYQRAGDEALSDAAHAAELFLEPLAHPFHGMFDVQQLAHDGAQYQGQDGDELVIAG